MVFMKQCQSFFHHKVKTDFLSLLQAYHQDDLKSIYTHPFNLDLFSGVLKPDIFGRYLRDDFYYLQRFSVGLNNLANKIALLYPDLAKQLGHLANDIVANEQNMQLQYHEHLQNMDQHIPGRTIKEYADYLTEPVSDDDMLVELIKYYPCFFIYAELGQRLIDPCALEDNPNKEWILTYTSQDFIRATNEFTKTINQASESASKPLRFKMKDGFRCSVQFEWAFINSVYYPPEPSDSPAIRWNTSTRLA